MKWISSTVTKLRLFKKIADLFDFTVSLLIYRNMKVELLVENNPVNRIKMANAITFVYFYHDFASKI